MSAIRNFEVLSEHECRQLPADEDVGRVAFMGDDGSLIIRSATPADFQPVRRWR
jgi:nitroimidazol reductase NimA-like FMN-containing flavoprotein (pyridoxamine 5'-phosphate oxidase superfamily)